MCPCENIPKKTPNSKASMYPQISAFGVRYREYCGEDSEDSWQEPSDREFNQTGWVWTNLVIHISLRRISTMHQQRYKILKLMW